VGKKTATPIDRKLDQYVLNKQTKNTDLANLMLQSQRDVSFMLMIKRRNYLPLMHGRFEAWSFSLNLRHRSRASSD
jgi:hypothetical protein